MSIYHCSIKIISRSTGRSAVASAAYRSGEKLMNDETGILHDFTSKEGVIMSEILLPENAPEAYQNRQLLWNEVQKIEKRCDAQLAREVEVAFPIEMTRYQQIECVRAYIQENFVLKGMIADWALHDKGNGNPHAHIMLTVRGFDDNRQWQQKTKTVFANSRDTAGRAIYDPSLPSYDPKDKERTAQYRIPLLDKSGKQKTRVRKGKGTEYLWEKINIPANDWNDRVNAEQWRSSWADHCNRYLDHEKQIDHRSYARQGLDLEPTIHEGYIARSMEREGRKADRCDINREIRGRNKIRNQIKTLALDIAKMVVEKARELYERITEFTGNTGINAGTGKNARTGRDTAERKRSTGAEASGMRKGTGGDEGETDSLDVIEREIEQRKPEITAADQQLEQLAGMIRERRKNHNERIRKLMERRRTSHTDGEDAGSDRTAGAGERRSSGGSIQVGNSAFTTGTEQLIRDLEIAISAATGAEETARAKRETREAERGRSGFAGKRETQIRKQETGKREEYVQGRSRSRGRSR